MYKQEKQTVDPQIIEQLNVRNLINGVDVAALCEIISDFKADPKSPEEVPALFQYAQVRSPICATVRQNVKVSWEFDIEAIDAGPDTGEDRHGVNFPNLAATVQAVKETPVLAKCKFYTSAEWLGGGQDQVTTPR